MQEYPDLQDLFTSHHLIWGYWGWLHGVLQHYFWGHKSSKASAMVLNMADNIKTEKHRHDAPEGAKIWDMYNKFQLNSKLQQTNDNNFFRFNKTTWQMELPPSPTFLNLSYPFKCGSNGLVIEHWKTNKRFLICIQMVAKSEKDFWGFLVYSPQ